MSAWLCSEEHINVIVNTIGGDAGDFILLVNENLRSLEARYPGRDFLKDWQREAGAYRFKQAAPGNMTQVVKCCDSYDYQACETEDYEASMASVIVESARKVAIALGGKQNGPEYDRAEWSL